MTTVASEAELLHCFREIDRPDVELSADLSFPLAVDEVLAWASGPRVHLMFCERPGGRLRGIVFHRNSGSAPDMAAMCEWCHSVRGHGGVKLMSVCVDERRRVGLYLCSDVGCVARSRGMPGPDDVPDGADSRERTRRILRRMSEFASRRLF